jgi:hypothetical protein
MLIDKSYPHDVMTFQIMRRIEREPNRAARFHLRQNKTIGRVLRGIRLKTQRDREEAANQAPPQLLHLIREEIALRINHEPG